MFKIDEIDEKVICHLPTIEWLVSDERRTGRSTALACAFIKKAILNKGREISIFDHHVPPSGFANLDSLRHAISRLSNDMIIGTKSITYYPSKFALKINESKVDDNVVLVLNSFIKTLVVFSKENNIDVESIIDLIKTEYVKKIVNE